MSGPRWEIEPSCPPDWAERLARCGGGVFHAPVGLEVSGLSGEPWYATYSGDGDAQGIAVGLWRRCRLSVRPRHVYLPSGPAFADTHPDARPAALALLVDALVRDGAAEVTMDSFDQVTPATVLPAAEPPAGAVQQSERREYVVRLDAAAETLVQHWSPHHRRQLAGIDAAGWDLRLLDGAPARELLVTVQRHAAARAADRGSGFELPATSIVAVPFDPARPWGVSLFTAWRGDTPLAAALIGWAGRRAYYLQGGATPEGYGCNASLWLHWRTLTTLAGAGFTAYSLGGVPAAAAQPGAPAFGLHRFKAGFGSQVLPCRGLRWDLRPGHLRAHRVAAWGRLRVRGSRAGV